MVSPFFHRHIIQAKFGSKWYYSDMHQPVFFDEYMLVTAGRHRSVVEHCMAVEALASSIASKVKIAVDHEAVRLGALFHDIGRARTHGIRHAIVGVEMGRSIGLPENVLLIIERHIGAGISADEAERLGLPRKDYIPQTPEEKIVSYADNLTIGTKHVDFNRALERFRQMLGPEHEGVEMFIRQHREIEEWLRRSSGR